MNQISRNLVLWLFLIMGLMIAYSLLHAPIRQPEQLTYSDFRQAIVDDRIGEATIREREIRGKYKYSSGAQEINEFITPLPSNEIQVSEMMNALHNARVKVAVEKNEDDTLSFIVLSYWLPVLVVVGLWFVFMRQVQVGGGKALSFGKSRARLLDEGPSKVTFEDVAGINESKSELEAIVQFLKDPKKFTKLGGRIPKGVLLAGSPGTGKTLLARAIAGEAGVPFFTISGSDFVEMFVGVGASRVRDLFVRAKKNAPCIVFIDEIDAVGRHRGAGLGGGHDEREQTLNQLLVEMDGFEPNEGVILIAATNRPDVLDPALLRPGRFDRTVIVPLPDVRGREGVLKVHTKKVPLSPDVSLQTIARGTPGFSGADLANLVNEAALFAAMQEAEMVNMSHFEFAKDKIVMGVERRSMVLSEQERKVSAYHEAGHAVAAKMIPGADPVHKVTIVPRGVALGLMQQLPEDDRHNYTKEYWLDRICIAFGGRVAEELVFAEITTGASSDIHTATNIARRMVCEWGMSENLGPLNYGKRDDNVFLGRDFGQAREYSEKTADLIDDEVRRIIDGQVKRARELLSTNRKLLDALAEALLEKETLDADQVNLLFHRFFNPPGTIPPMAKVNVRA